MGQFDFVKFFQKVFIVLVYWQFTVICLNKRKRTECSNSKEWQRKFHEFHKASSFKIWKGIFELFLKDAAFFIFGVTLKKYLLFNAGFVNKLAEVESYFSNF
jgi:hypothetical protein